MTRNAADSHDLNDMPAAPQRKRRSYLSGFAILSALVMFVIIGGSVGTQIVRQMVGTSEGADQAMVTALLLNIALILLIWRRTSALSDEVDVYRQAEARAQHMAITDPLTNLFNRRAVREKTAELSARASRRGKSIAFMMIDLDGFKKVNDLLGHDAGDIVLRETANRMRDIAPPSSIIARLGGDEFGICVVYEPEYPETVDRIAQDLIDVVGRPINVADTDQKVTASLGISRPTPDCESIEMLMRRADIALYSAKQNGRNGFAWFESDMETALLTQNSLEDDIRAGIANDEFVPYFEPQIDLDSGDIVGFEMLARWVSPIRGLISPESFISAAEASGQIGELSLSVIRKALIEARNWDPRLTLSVNISPVQLSDTWLSQKIVKLMVETNFPANRLEIEITEGAIFDNLSMAQSNIASLKNQGIAVALDDFGTGYSSLTHLSTLSVDRIKIDRSFVATLDENSESLAIVKAIAGLGATLNVLVTAEGIDSKATADRLKEFGCTTGQGWLFGQPMATEQVRTLLAEENLIPAHRNAEAAHEAMKNTAEMLRRMNG